MSSESAGSAEGLSAEGPPAEGLADFSDGDRREAALRVLRECGWSEGRFADPQETAEANRGEGGAPAHPAALAVLAEFGGLHVWFPSPRADGDRADARFGVTTLSCWTEQWNAAAGEVLFPVGEFGGGNCVLLSGESGALYGAFDYILGRLGPDPLTGIGRLVLDERPLEPRLVFESPWAKG